jgi:hypothetical protein
MSKIIYRYEQFVIKDTEDGLVVVNNNGDYEHHSHVKNFESGRVICKLAAKRKLPRSRDTFFINALIRVSKNKKYIRELEQILREIEEEKSKQKNMNKEES